jgi:NADH dehydrogenase
MAQTAAAPGASREPAVVLGAGYAGVAATQELKRRGHGIPVVLVDRNPVHILRTELYEVGKLAETQGDVGRWTVPLADVLDGELLQHRTGAVQAIDLDARRVRVDGEDVSFGTLAICLGSVPAYYGVSGAKEHTHQVYRLSGAIRLANAVRELEERSPRMPPLRVPKIVVVGGGSTGTELAAEIATTDWARIVGHPVRAPQVLLIGGAMPFLAGLPEPLVRHARTLLVRAGVALFEGSNVVEVQSDRVRMEDGTVLPFDLCVWCAGVEAHPLVRQLPTPHGRAGRIKVTEHLELPDRPGIFAVGDVMEFADPETGALAPATAQAALSEALVAARNMVARMTAGSLEAYRYRERGVIVSVGVGKAAARLRHVTLWGSPAALLKAIVQKEYALTAARGAPPVGL